MISWILAAAALAIWVLPLVLSRPSSAVSSLPPIGPSIAPPVTAPSFVEAVRAVDVAVAYLVETEQYGSAQQQAARVLRAAVVEGATPPVPPGVEASL